MDTAVERIVEAINGGEKIGVFADYDVDGACSASLLIRFSALGRNLHVYVPDGIAEGCSLIAALLKLKEQGVSLVITVDCGTCLPCRCRRLDVLVIDHHVAELGCRMLSRS